MSAYTDTTPKGTENVWDGNDTIKNEFQSHKECEQHYSAAKQSTIDLKIRLDAYQNKYGWNFEAPGLPGTPTPGPSTGTEQHWGSGNLWKPKSDSDGKAVFVMKNLYTEGHKDGGKSLVGDVLLYDKNGALVEKLHQTPAGNGGRLNQRSGHTAQQLGAMAPLTIKWTFQGSPEFIVVTDPTRRLE